MIKRISGIISNPAAAALNAKLRVSRDSVFSAYDSLSRSAGLNKLYLVISFDCDTDEDLETVWNVHTKLAGMGIRAVYAASGAFLRKGEKVFSKIASTGAEFINHGNAEHTYFDNKLGRYESCFFYDTLPRAEVENDITGGDKALKEILGVTPSGFRAPHFGTFQKREDLRFIHQTIKTLGYEFSTSTMPFYGLTCGAAFRDFGCWEIPVSGMWSKPLAVLDSWEFFRAPGRTHTGKDYRREGEAIAEYFSKKNISGILNYYADPSHIVEDDDFYDTIKAWSSVADNVDYSTLLRELANGKA